MMKSERADYVDRQGAAAFNLVSLAQTAVSAAVVQPLAGAAPRTDRSSLIRRHQSLQALLHLVATSSDHYMSAQAMAPACSMHACGKGFWAGSDAAFCLAQSLARGRLGDSGSRT
jgi:hypothetical protein